MNQTLRRPRGYPLLACMSIYRSRCFFVFFQPPAPSLFIGGSPFSKPTHYTQIAVRIPLSFCPLITYFIHFTEY